MKTIRLDLETYSSVDLTRASVYRYSESPDFQILLCAYAVEDDPVTVLDLTKAPLPEEVISILRDPEYLKVAWNANFERTCLSRYLGEQLDPVGWSCSMVHAATLGLPRSLADAGKALGLPEDQQKMKEGKALIQYFCKPCRPTKSNGGRTRNLPQHDPQKWSTFIEYNRRDVETERWIDEKLDAYPMHPDEMKAYWMDQRINDRGVLVDVDLMKNAIRMNYEHAAELSTEAQIITGLENVNSVAQLKKWLDIDGTLDKKAIAKMRKDGGLSEVADRVLAIRQELGKTSVSKYEAMERNICKDGRMRGLFAFYGAVRTGRWAGKYTQLQNLVQNHIPDLELAREIVKSGDRSWLQCAYGNVASTLSELIRTALIAKPRHTFCVADFSAIEARVVAWLADETWRQELFRQGGDIYCQSASKMFHVPVEKHGINGHLRQKGKVAELACIAEGQLVLTDRGEIPIEEVKLTDKLWDGENWVTHDGVICKGRRLVITYDGLTATCDHEVWVEGRKEPIPFGFAARDRARLVRSGSGGKGIRLGEGNQPGEEMHPVQQAARLDEALCAGGMHRLRRTEVDFLGESESREDQWMSKLLDHTAISEMAGQEIHSGKAEMHQSERPKLQTLRRTGNKILLWFRLGSLSLDAEEPWPAEQEDGNRPDRQQRKLRTGKHQAGQQNGESTEQENNGSQRVRPEVLAIRPRCCGQETLSRFNSGADHPRCGDSGVREAEELAGNPRTARVYDIRNAGEHHRFTVSGRLVHNCGYGGSVGAMINMGALEMGLTEEELQPIVTAWREASPHIVQLWWDIDSAARDTIEHKLTSWRMDLPHGLSMRCSNKLLHVLLPSGRQIRYWKPAVEDDEWRGKITYEGVEIGKWARIDTYGPKIFENIVQATARDCLRDAMMKVEEKYPGIVMHIHDEMVVEVPEDQADEALAYMLEVMSTPVSWAPGLILKGDGYQCRFYRKD